MTKNEFISCVPPVLFHNDYGYGRLVILEDTQTGKGACYKHSDITTFNTYERSWRELYLHLARELRANELMC